MNTKTNPRQWIFLLVLIVAMTNTSYNVITNQHAASNLRRVALRNCQKIEQLKSYSESAIIRALKTLPTISYYQTHQVELGAQIFELKRVRHQFAPKSCRS